MLLIYPKKKEIFIFIFLTILVYVIGVKFIPVFPDDLSVWKEPSNPTRYFYRCQAKSRRILLYFHPNLRGAISDCSRAIQLAENQNAQSTSIMSMYAHRGKVYELLNELDLAVFDLLEASKIAQSNELDSIADYYQGQAREIHERSR